MRFADLGPVSAAIKGYRGVVATKDIAAGVALVRIARSCCIGPQTTDASKDAWRRAMASADEVHTTGRLTFLGLEKLDSSDTVPTGSLLLYLYKSTRVVVL